MTTLSLKGKLDQYNEHLATKGLHMHPTKGVRRLTYIRLVASTITEDMKRGVPWNMKTIQATLRAAAHDR